MDTDLGYGARLSGEDYDRRIVALHREAPAMPSQAEDADLRRKELDLAIDFRLGIAFPPEKRAALWAIQQRLEKERLWLGLRYGLRRMLSKNAGISEIERRSDLLTATMIAEFAKVLNEAELRAFFELDPDDDAGSPD